MNRMTCKGLFVSFAFLILFISSGFGTETENDSEKFSLDAITVTGNEGKNDAPDAGAEFQMNPGGTNVKVKLNETEVVEFEIKPNSITREQLLRLRKFLNKNGLQMRNMGEDASEEAPKKKLGDGGRNNAKIHKTKMNLADEVGKTSYPEKLSEVTAEDILPLLPQNLSSFDPYIYELRNERCQKHAMYFMQGLHNLTKWAVQSKLQFRILATSPLTMCELLN